MATLKTAVWCVRRLTGFSVDRLCHARGDPRHHGAADGGKETAVPRVELKPVIHPGLKGV